MRKKAIYLSLIVSIALSVNTLAGTYSGGSGSAAEPYRIGTPEDLNDIRNHVEDYNKCFVMLNNINMGAYSYTTAVIAPDTDDGTSGFQGPSFTGIFDGNNHTIASLVIDDKGADNDFLGLFGFLYQGSNVKDLKLEDVSITGDYFSGALCGYNWYGTINNCVVVGAVVGHEVIGGLCGVNREGVISDCNITCSVTAYDSFGGLCGWNNSGVISNCVVGGSVSGDDYFGGLCGNNENGIISNCAVSSSVTADYNESDFLGGLCGYNNGGTIINSYATGPVTGVEGSHNLGGLSGSNSGGIINCYATGTVTGYIGLGGLCGANGGGIVNCYATGPVTTDYNNACYLGGLCGGNSGGIVNCYSSGSVTADVNNANYLGGLCGDSAQEGIISSSYFLDTAGPDNGDGTPLTDTQMKQQVSFVNWDFVNETINGYDDIWTIKEGVRYPEFVWPIVQFIGWDGVDFFDYSFFAYYYGQTDCSGTNDCYGADLNFSGVVDANDLGVFVNYWLFGK